MVSDTKRETKRQRLLDSILKLGDVSHLSMQEITDKIHIHDKSDKYYVANILKEENIAYLKRKDLRNNFNQPYLEEIKKLDNLEKLTLDEIKEKVNFPKTIYSLKLILVKNNIDFALSDIEMKRRKKLN